MSGLDAVYGPIRRELEAVETLLWKTLGGAKDKDIKGMNHHLLSSPGKRLRPALVLLTAKAAGIPSSDELALVHVGAAVELIHIASLVHDDVMDEAAIRHNTPTINARWGSTPAIAYADYLFAEAISLLAHVGNPEAVQEVASAISLMSQGQVIQVFQRDNVDISEETYLDIITKKTGALFCASCAAPLHLRETPYFKAVDAFCRHFGLAFQITDDLLDLLGTEEQLGKKPGQDILEGEYTLPLIRARKKMSSKERHELDTLLDRKDKGSIESIKGLVRKHGGDTEAAKEALLHIEKANDSLSGLPDSSGKKSLVSLLDMLSGKLPCGILEKNI